MEFYSPETSCFCIMNGMGITSNRWRWTTTLVQVLFCPSVLDHLDRWCGDNRYHVISFKVCIINHSCFLILRGSHCQIIHLFMIALLPFFLECENKNWPCFGFQALLFECLVWKCSFSWGESAMNKNVEQWVCESMLTIIDWTWLNNHAAFRFTKTVHIMVTSWLNHEIWRLEQNWEVWLETHSQHHKALPSTPVFFFSVPGHVSPFLYCSNDRGMVFERTASTSHVCVCRVLEPMTGKILPLAQETVPKYVAFLSHRGTPVVIHSSSSGVCGDCSWASKVLHGSSLFRVFTMAFCCDRTPKGQVLHLRGGCLVWDIPGWGTHRSWQTDSASRLQA